MKSICALFCLVTASSCATAKFQPGKPVTHGGPFGTYLQDGERVNPDEVRDYLKTQPATEYKAKASQTWEYVGIVPGAVGGFLIGYNLFDKDRTSDTGLWIGVGLSAVGIACGVYAERLLASATDTYNQTLVGGKKSGSLRVFPLLSAQPGTPAPGAGVGLSLSFR